MFIKNLLALIVLIFSLTLISCSHHSKVADYFAHDLNKVYDDVSNKTNQSEKYVRSEEAKDHPNFYLPKTQVLNPNWQNHDSQMLAEKKLVEENRTPAGVSGDQSKTLDVSPVPDQLKWQKALVEEKKWKSSQFYFASLYSQWKIFAALANQNQNLNACPHYHQEKIFLDEEMNSKNQKELKVLRKNTLKTYDYEFLIGKNELLPFHPILSLNFQNKSLMDHMLENNQFVIDSKIIKQALTNHFELVGNELNALCENGYTEHSYIYENLISYIKTHPQFTTHADSLRALLKIPVYYNLHILSSMGGNQNSQVYQFPFAQLCLMENSVVSFESFLYQVRNVGQNMKKMKNRMDRSI